MPIKIEIEFFPVEEKLPVDDWRKQPWWDEEFKNNTLGEFIAFVDCDDPNEDAEMCTVSYFADDGFVYSSDLSTKYDGNPWKVTHWANKPELNEHNISIKDGTID